MFMRVIGLGLLVGDTFNRMIEKVMLMNQLNAVRASGEITRFLRDITPISSGFMRSCTRTWDYKRRGQWGFSFNVGFRKSNFPGEFYAPHVIYGTGLYGIKRSPIKPRFAKMLAWETKKGWVSAKTVRGQRPNPILEATEKMGLRLLQKSCQQAFIQAWRIK